MNQEGCNMKHVQQFSIILLISVIGELLKTFLPLPVPASVYGLIIMLVALLTGILKLDQVKGAADFLVEIMPVMFVPAGAGLITAWSTLKPICVPVLIMTFISTVIVMVVTGKVTQGVIRKILYDLKSIGNCIMCFLSFYINNGSDTAVIMFKFRAVEALLLICYFSHFSHPFIAASSAVFLSTAACTNPRNSGCA